MTLAFALPFTAALTAVGSPAGAAVAPAPGRVLTGPAHTTGRAPVTALLPTGERVTVGRSATGRPVVDVARVATSGLRGSFVRRTTTHGTSVVPVTALPYVGRLVDPALFDVSRAAGAAKVPVRLTFSGALPAVPGVTITSRSTGAASGYLTPRSARTFGAALAKQFRADAAKGFPARTTLFGATGIRSATAGPVTVTPQFPMRTLVIKALDSTGAPVPFGVVDVFAVDDASRYAGFGGFVVDGEARVSVPVGTYALHAVSFATDAQGEVTSIRTPVVDDYVVSAQNQVVTLDDRLATARPSMTTPTSASLDSLAQTWGRIDAAHNGAISSTVVVSGAVPVLVQPQPKPALGTLRSAVQFTQTSSPLSGPPVLYTAGYVADGIPADQSHVFSTARAEKIRPTYYADPQPRQAQLARAVLDPEVGGVGVGVVTPLPSRRTEYVLGELPGGAPAVWNDVLFASPDEFTNPFAGSVFDGDRLVRPGTTYRPDWLRGPQLQQVPTATDGFAAEGLQLGCPACRSADTMLVVLDPAQDTTPGHSIATFARADGKRVARFRVLRNGVSIFDEDDVIGAELPVAAGAARYRVIDVVDRVPSLAGQSTRTRTDLTFVSSATDGGPVPADQECFLGEEVVSGCTVLPILTTRIDLPVDGRGAVPLGASRITLTAAHLDGAPRIAVTSATVDIRFPGGTWTALPVQRTGDGRYTADLSLTADRAGASADLRVTVRDAAGGVLRQTAIGAFGVNAS